MNIFLIIFIIEVCLGLILIPELRNDLDNRLLWWILVLSDFVCPTIRAFFQWLYIFSGVGNKKPEIEIRVNPYDSANYFALACIWYAYDFTNFAWMSFALAGSLAITESIITTTSSTTKK